MSEHNHHRGTSRKLPSVTHTANGKDWGYPDKSGQVRGRRSLFADVSLGASVVLDYIKGHREMARVARSAKKYANTRFRRREAAATRDAARFFETEMA